MRWCRILVRVDGPSLDQILGIWLMDTCGSLPHVRTAPVLLMYCLGLGNMVDVDAVDTFTFMFCIADNKTRRTLHLTTGSNHHAKNRRICQADG
jgi:hypothetical protein